MNVCLDVLWALIVSMDTVNVIMVSGEGKYIKEPVPYLSLWSIPYADVVQYV